MWVAPAKGSGCVRLSAMIYEGKDAWYADAGGLTQIVCEQKADKTRKAMSEDECCACDEAKYNVSAALLFSAAFSCHSEYICFVFAFITRLGFMPRMNNEKQTTIAVCV